MRQGDPLRHALETSHVTVCARAYRRRRRWLTGTPRERVGRLRLVADAAKLAIEDPIPLEATRTRLPMIVAGPEHIEELLSTS